MIILVYLLAVLVEPLSDGVKLRDCFVRVVMLGIGSARLLANQLRHRSLSRERENTMPKLGNLSVDAAGLQQLFQGTGRPACGEQAYACAI